MLFLLLSLGKFSQSSSASIQWTDDFDDGVLDGWTIVEGGFVIEDGRVSGTNREINVMRHESTNSYGYWSFDVHFIRTDYHLSWHVFFIASEDILWDRPQNGYCLEGWAFFYQIMKTMDYEPNYLDGFSNGTLCDQIHFMMHFDIVRRYDGYMYVWANYSTNHIFFDTYDVSHTTSAYFDIVLDHHQQVWIDNICVDNNPENGPDPIDPALNTETINKIPPEVLLVTPWAIGLCLVVGGLVVWRHRQKKVDITPGEELKE